MTIFRMHDAQIQEIARLLLRDRPAGLNRVEIRAEWYYTDSGLGPNFHYLDQDGHELQKGGGWVLSREVSRTCRALLKEYIGEDFPYEGWKTLDDGWVANRFKLTVYADGRAQVEWENDPQLSDRKLEEIRSGVRPDELPLQLKTLADYKANKNRTYRMRGLDSDGNPKDDADASAGEKDKPEQNTPGAASDSPPPGMSPGALFGAIVNETQAAAPEGWAQLIIDGEVWTEPDSTGQPITEISADFWARMADGRLRQVTVANVIAPMNALKYLQGCWFKDDGTPWRRIRISYSPGASSVDLAYDQSGPPQGVA